MFLISSCSYKKVLDSNYYCRKFKFNCTRENQIIYFKTSKGDFEVELYGVDNPVTVSNFIENIRKNIYINRKFYKIINYPQVKVIHAGINSGNNFYAEKDQILNKLRPSIPLEIKFKKGIEPKYKYQIKAPSEYQDLMNFFENGSIAMVKKGDRNSSSTEFFFVTSKFSELDGRYSIFGKIVTGFDVLEKIDKEDFIYEIKISN